MGYPRITGEQESNLAKVLMQEQAVGTKFQSSEEDSASMDKINKEFLKRNVAEITESLTAIKEASNPTDILQKLTAGIDNFTRSVQTMAQTNGMSEASALVDSFFDKIVTLLDTKITGDSSEKTALKAKLRTMKVFINSGWSSAISGAVVIDVRLLDQDKATFDKDLTELPLSEIPGVIETLLKSILADRPLQTSFPVTRVPYLKNYSGQLAQIMYTKNIEDDSTEPGKSLFAIRNRLDQAIAFADIGIWRKKNKENSLGSPPPQE